MKSSMGLRRHQEFRSGGGAARTGGTWDQCFSMEASGADAESGEGVKLHQFDKVQFAGVLKESGDRMDLTALVTVFDSDGNQLPPKEGIPDTANGVRIPLEVLPNIAYSLPTPGPTAPK